MPVLFPFADAWWLYGLFVTGVLALLALDLGLLRREARELRWREAALWCATWVSLALAFVVGLYGYVSWRFADDPRLAGPGLEAETVAWQLTLEFLSGYLVEYALSIDNIFVFVLVLRYFAVPARCQHRVLFYGILGALVFRAAFIALGAVLLEFHWVVWLFGLFLVVTGVRMILGAPDAAEPEHNPLVRAVRRWLPVTAGFRGQRFVVRENGRLWATPLLVALLCLEASDVVFALDSVPAIFALTREPFIVFTSNVFAILGLRSMFFMLGGALERFHLLRYGLALVLVFVGLKMVWLDAAFGGKFPIGVSLALIATLLAGSVVASLLVRPRPQPSGRGRGRRRPPRGRVAAMRVKYRVGVMPGPWPAGPAGRDFFWRFVELCEKSEIDSLWFSERLSSPVPIPEPITAMAAIAARTTRLKFGPSVFVTPFRNPVLMAREIAMVDYLSGGRLLPAFGIGAEQEREFLAAGVPFRERGRRTDEALAIMRRCWTEDEVTFAGEFWRLDRVTVLPKPVQQPLELWIGGNSEAAMRRAGRLGDGWIPSFITPEQFRVGVEKTQAFAAEAGRAVPADHFGALFYCCLDPEPAAARALAMPFVPRGRIDDAALERCTAFGPPALVRERLEEYVAGGGSKFIVRPMCPPDRMLDQLAQLAAEVIPAFHRR